MDSHKHDSRVLPVTARLVDHLRAQGFTAFPPNTQLVAMPHILPDVVDLLSAMIELGMKPENIHILAKQYSQVNDVRDRLVKMGIDVTDYTPAPIGKYYDTLLQTDLPRFWDRCEQKIDAAVEKDGPQKVLVLDDGGRMLSSIPNTLLDNPKLKIGGVEQTTNGFDVLHGNGHEIDIVVPAASALKLEFEPPFVADAAMRKLRSKLGIFRNREVSIVGIGKIGLSMAQILADNQNTVFVYDKGIHIENGEVIDPNNILPSRVTVCEAPSDGRTLSEAKVIRESTPPGAPRFYICNGIEQAIQSSNYVFGCTGRDITEGMDFDHFDFQGNYPYKDIGETRFISASSGDKEFLSLLRWMSQQPGANHLEAMRAMAAAGMLL